MGQSQPFYHGSLSTPADWASIYHPPENM